MELADLKRLALAAREFSVPVGNGSIVRSITLRAPTQHQITLAALRSGMRNMSDDQASTAVLERALLVGAVVRWGGVLVADVLPEHPQAKDPLTCEVGAVELVLDANPEWATTLGHALLAKMAAQRDVQDTAEKN